METRTRYCLSTIKGRSYYAGDFATLEASVLLTWPDATFRHIQVEVAGGRCTLGAIVSDADGNEIAIISMGEVMWVAEPEVLT